MQAKKGAAADIDSPLFPTFSLALFVLPKVLETNIWFQFIKTQLMAGFKKILQWQKFCYVSNRVGRITDLFPEI